MSDYHILDGTEEARTYRVVFHVSVPDENNSVSVNLRTALAADVGVVKTSKVPGLAAAEQTLLTNGELVEVVEAYTRLTGNTLAQDQAALDARFTTLTTKVANRLRDEYKFWGFARDVP